MQEPLDAVNMLNAREEAGDPAVVVYLLGKSLNKLTPADSNDTGQFIEVFVTTLHVQMYTVLCKMIVLSLQSSIINPISSPLSTKS